MSEHQNIEYKSAWHEDYLKWVCGFSVTLFKTTSEQIHDNVGVDVGVNVAKEVMETLNLIKKNPEYTTEQIAEITNKASRTIERHIAKLKEAGILIRKGSDKVGYWEINTENER